MDIQTSFEPFEFSALVDPTPVIHELLERCPVTHSDQHEQFWVVSPFAEVASAARRADLFSSQLNGASLPNFDMGFPRGPIEIDPPQHIMYRGPLMAAFSPRAVLDFEPEMRAIAAEMLDQFADRGEIDLAQEFAIPYPAVVATRFLGFPAGDAGLLLRLARTFLGGDMDAKLSGVGELMEYLDKLYEEREIGIDADIIGTVRSLVIDDRPITLGEFQGAMLVLFAAGLDTTGNAASLSLELLGRMPDVRQRLVADPTRLPVAIEELLRFVTPVPLSGRTATEDTSILDTNICAGEHVALLWMAANFDPTEFSNPDDLDIERQPNRHMSFGSGIHRCLGMHLARLELRIMLEEVLARMPDFELVKGGFIRAPGVTRHVEGLRVTYTPFETAGGPT